MVQIPHREWKIQYLLKHFDKKSKDIHNAYGYRLIKTKCNYWSTIMLGIELHHRISDSKKNRKNYPLLIHSIINLVPLDHDFHINNKNFLCYFYTEAEKIERFLERHPMIAAFVNGRI